MPTKSLLTLLALSFCFAHPAIAQTDSDAQPTKHLKNITLSTTRDMSDLIKQKTKRAPAARAVLGKDSSSDTPTSNP